MHQIAEIDKGTEPELQDCKTVEIGAKQLAPLNAEGFDWGSWFRSVRWIFFGDGTVKPSGTVPIENEHGEITGSSNCVDQFTSPRLSAKEVSGRVLPPSTD